MIKSFLEGFDAAGRLLLFFVKHELAHPCAYRRGGGLKLSKSGKQFLNSTTPAHFSPGGALKEGIACILSEGYLDPAVADPRHPKKSCKMLQGSDWARTPHFIGIFQRWHSVLQHRATC